MEPDCRELPEAGGRLRAGRHGQATSVNETSTTGSMMQQRIVSLEEGQSVSMLSVRSRIVVLGGGIAGLTVTRELEHLFRGRRDVEIVLVSRDNFLHLTPLLFEACSGVLELRHCA